MQKKRYRASIPIADTVEVEGRKIVKFVDIKIEFIWSIKMKHALVVLTFGNEIYDLNYNPFSYVNAARVFLRTVKEIEKIHSFVELDDYINKLKVKDEKETQLV